MIEILKKGITVVEHKVFAIIGDLYKQFDGDFVEIDRAFMDYCYSMGDKDTENTKKYGVTPEQIRGFIGVLNEKRKTEYLSGKIDLDTEDFVIAYTNGLTIEGYMGSTHWTETENIKRERRNNIGRAKGEPINERTVRRLIEALREEYDADVIKSLLEKGYAGISDEQQRKYVIYGFGFEYLATPSQVKQWLIDNALSVEEMIEILDKGISVEEYKRKREETRREQEKTRLEEVGLKIPELVIKLLDYYVPREKDILNGDGDEEYDAIDLVVYALDSNWKEFEEDEEQAVQKMYEDCGVTREEVFKYYYNYDGYMFEDWEGLIAGASRGMSLRESKDEYEETTHDEYMQRMERWRKCVKIIYSATSSNIGTQEIKGFEEVYSQLLATKKQMQQRGVIEKEVGTRIQELVIKLLDYYVPRGKDILNGEEEGEYKRHAIECVVAALEYGEEYFKGDEAQAVHGMYESCGVTPDEIMQYLLDNGINDEFTLIDIVSRGMSLAEFKDVKHTHGEEQILMDMLRTTYEKISEGRTGILDMGEINRIYEQCVLLLRGDGRV